MKRTHSNLAFILGLMITAAVLIASCNTVPNVAPSTDPTVPAHFLTYTDEAGFFSISFPSNWEAFPPEIVRVVPVEKGFFQIFDSNTILEGLVFVFVAEMRHEPKSATSSVNVVVQGLPEGSASLNEITTAKIERTRQIAQDYREFSRTTSFVDGRQAVIIDWEQSLSGQVRGRCVQMYTLSDRLIWKVTCYVVSQDYSYYREDLYNIVRSLRIWK